MQIKKRTLPMYIFLNCITLGIYGFIEAKAMDREINAICKGDGEQPHFSYTGAVLIRGISAIIGMVVGLILGIKSGSAMGFFATGATKTAITFALMAVFGLIGSVVGSSVTGIYFKYWWYKQANRLKLNAYRYGLEIKESGIDNFLFRTAINVLLVPITLIMIVLSILIPAFIIWLISLGNSEGALVCAAILLFVFSLPLMFLNGELSAGSCFAMHFMFKNLNRYADVYRNGAQPFDPMGYEYYPSQENMIAGVAIQNNQVANEKSVNDEKFVDDENDSKTTVGVQGILLGEKGSCAGYMFELISGEEIIIGKDAKMSSVVIDSAYKEISRKHAGVCFDVRTGQYRVTDYSSNGTTVNGEKLTPGVPVFVPAGSVLELANGKNMFRLG